MEQSTLISLTPATDQTDALSAFLKEGAKIVEETEPKTLLWTALKSAETQQCAIFDTFEDESGRAAHFAGKVAAALKANASVLVDGGWETGVILNIRNATIVGAKVGGATDKVKLAVWIPLTAKADKGQELAALLSVGAQVVSDTEPMTLHWFGLQFDETHFGILDFFEVEGGIEAHFAGQAAAAVKANADNLIEGGWDQGVVANVHQFDVLAFVKG